MATFKYLVLPHQRKEDGTYNVKIRVTQKGKSKYLKTECNVSDHDLSKKKEGDKVKLKIKNRAVIDLMEDLVMSYKKKLTAAGSSVELWSVDKVVDYLQHGSDTFYLDFFSYGSEVSDRIEKEGRRSTANINRAALRMFAKFVGRNTLDINSITVSMLRAFDRFMAGSEGKNNRQTSGGKNKTYFQRLASIYSMAKKEHNDEDRGLIRMPFSPFSNYRPQCNKTTVHRTLTFDQVQQIIDLPYVCNKDGSFRLCSLNLAKDLFLMSFALMGINAADLYEASGLVGDILIYNRQKTRNSRDDKARFEVRIEPEISAVVDRYKDGSKERVFLFHKRYSTLGVFNSCICRGMKQLGEKIGVEGLTYYHARHSFATLSANRAGIDIATVDEMLNHTNASLKLARVYIERDFSVLWRANRKLMEMFNWEAVR